MPLKPHATGCSEQIEDLGSVRQEILPTGGMPELNLEGWTRVNRMK